MSNFNTLALLKIDYMFWNCWKLNTIYVSDLWNVDNVTNSTNMFLSCSRLSGATSFNSTKTDKTMANYTTGYLTYKANN